MPRRAAAGARPLDPDSQHGSKLVQQVINRVMVDGKKSTAEQIVYDALDRLSQKTGEEPVVALENSIKILTPVLEVRSRRVGGATYQVPVEVPARRARTLAVRWLVEFARNRRWRSGWRTSWPTRASSRATPTSARTTSTAWRRQTRPSPTTAGNSG
jgi:small subunit ribosomal protein S7